MSAARALSSDVSLERLREAIEASWRPDTAYLDAERAGNPAYGQCYPTARTVQTFFPEYEIASGEVQTGASTEWHFWNVRKTAVGLEHIDLTWSQFPPGARVTHFKLLDRNALNDSPPTVARCELMLQRVRAHLAER